MTFFTVHPFHSFNLAVVLLIAGKILTLNIDLLRRYSIPEPVAGGFLCIAVTGLLWALFDLKVSFEVGIRDFLLLVFFAGIGLKSDIRTLLAGGRPLVILLILATSFILLQNFAGMGLARLFGMEPKAGLMVGSVSLTGGVGTTLAWAPIFAEKLGITNALELGVAANTVGLIAACVIGGPIAALLIRRGGLQAQTQLPDRYACRRRQLRAPRPLAGADAGTGRVVVAGLDRVAAGTLGNARQAARDRGALQGLQAAVRGAGQLRAGDMT